MHVLTSTMIGGISRDSSSYMRASFWFSEQKTKFCVTVDAVCPTSPMETKAGRRRYLRVMRSTAGGMVAENMKVCL